MIIIMITLTVIIITCDTFLTTYSYPALPFLIDIPSIIEPGPSGLQHGEDIDLSLWGFSQHAPSFPKIESFFLVDALYCSCLLSPFSAPIHQSTIFPHCFLADKYFRHHCFNMAMENSHIRWCFRCNLHFHGFSSQVWHGVPGSDSIQTTKLYGSPPESRWPLRPPEDRLLHRGALDAAQCHKAFGQVPWERSYDVNRPPNGNPRSSNLGPWLGKHDDL